jgi:hypothetical protein
VLAQAEPVRLLVASAADGAEPELVELQRMLVGVLPAGPVAIAMTVALLIALLPRAQRLIRLADELASRQAGPAGREMADSAIDFALDRLEDVPVRGTDMTAANRHIRRAALLLNDLDDRAAHVRLRQARLERVRRKVDIACRARLAAELATFLLAADGVVTADASEIAALDEAAIALRRFSGVARHIGSADQHDMLLRRAAESLCPNATETMPARGHRIRLMEILLGPEAAQAMLTAAAE